MDVSSYIESDKAAIEQLFEAVFTDSEGPAEGALIAKLVVDLMNSPEDEEVIGFVAKDAGHIVGSIFFTRLTFEAPVEAFILAPVAVRTDYQGQGVGTRLIAYGLEQMKEKGARLVCTYGDPAFYSRVGFRGIGEEIIKAPRALSQPQGWLCQSLDGSEISPVPDRPRCVDALDRPEYW